MFKQFRSALERNRTGFEILHFLVLTSFALMMLLLLADEVSEDFYQKGFRHYIFFDDEEAIKDLFVAMIANPDPSDNRAALMIAQLVEEAGEEHSATMLYLYVSLRDPRSNCAVQSKLMHSALESFLEGPALIYSLRCGYHADGEELYLYRLYQSLLAENLGWSELAEFLHPRIKIQEFPTWDEYWEDLPKPFQGDYSKVEPFDKMPPIYQALPHY